MQQMASATPLDDTQRTPFMQALLTLQPNIDKLPAFRQNFARSLVSQWHKYGELSPKQEAWIFTLAKMAEEAGAVGPQDKAPPKPVPTQVENVAGILALFKVATGRIKFPKVEFGVKTPDGIEHEIRINVAGAAARFPGSITICRMDAQYGKVWIGRVRLDGQLDLKVEERIKHPVICEALVVSLLELSKDPAGFASEYGRRSGHCCFCSLRLTDDRSWRVGYGKTCARNYGLPWGERPEG